LLADCETMQEIATRYQPTEMLSAMAKNGRQFYPK
jgi:hypothetical protein